MIDSRIVVNDWESGLVLVFLGEGYVLPSQNQLCECIISCQTFKRA